MFIGSVWTVSYTHLDVYKRQVKVFLPLVGCFLCFFLFALPHVSLVVLTLIEMDLGQL